MYTINFNDEDQVEQLCKLLGAIEENVMNSTFVGQPFYNDDDSSVCIELDEVNGVRCYEKLYMIVRGDMELVYALYDSDGNRLRLTDNVRDMLDYTTCRDGICVFDGCDMCDKEEDDE